MHIYTENHFALEERYMARFGYPNTQEHLVHHIEFREQTVKFCLDAMVDCKSTPEEMFKYLSHW